MTSAGLCDDNIRDMINPYTETGTFGISWNGGNKPDQTLEYIRPFNNEIEVEDPLLISDLVGRPSNIFLKTQEARRYDIMQGGEPMRIYEDRVCPDPYNTVGTVVKRNVSDDDSDSEYEVEESSNFIDRVILFVLLVLLIIFLLSLKDK
jgi:hypothetical protein